MKLLLLSMMNVFVFKTLLLVIYAIKMFVICLLKF